jgi:hypothetical protein
VRVLELHGARAGGHHLDEVGAVANLLAHGRRTSSPPSASRYMPGRSVRRRRRRDDPSARQEARPAERAVAHGLADLDDQVAEAAHVAHGGDPHPQDLAASDAMMCACVPG